MTDIRLIFTQQDLLKAHRRIKELSVFNGILIALVFGEAFLLWQLCGGNLPSIQLPKWWPEVAGIGPALAMLLLFILRIRKGKQQ